MSLIRFFRIPNANGTVGRNLCQHAGWSCREKPSLLRSQDVVTFLLEKVLFDHMSTMLLFFSRPPATSSWVNLGPHSFATEEVKSACMEAFVVNKELRNRLRHSLSKDVCGWKRRSWDIVISSLRYCYLQSRYFALIDDSKKSCMCRKQKMTDKN